MAPELRKRKPLPEVQKLTNAGKSAKASPKGKRKAPEDASPVSLKKQRSVKKVAAEPKPAKKPAQKAKKVKPVEEEKVEEEDATIEVPDVSDDDEEEGKEAQALATELDSGDEDMTEGDNAFETGQDVGKIPKVSKQVQQAVKGSGGETGVLYIGRVPHGFYEHEMRQYFEQFGIINKLRLSRNKKTGASKHFAFVEFAEASTAEIVAKTMNNYLLFGHILKCRIIPKDQVHEDLFKGANRRFKKVPWNKMAGNKLQKPLTESAWAAKVSNEQSKRTKRAAKLKEIGYEFEAPEMKDVPAPAPIEEKVAEVKAVEDAPVEKDEEVKVDEVEKIEVTVEAVEEAKPEAEEPEVEVEVEVTTKKAAPKAKATRAKATRGRGRKARA